MPEKLRVATFNIHHAEGKDGTVNLKRIADLIAGLEVDLIALQELDVRARRSKNVDQPGELADLLNMHVYFAPTLSFDQGEYGIALAGRKPFKATVQMLPRVADEEPRAAIVASWNGLAVVTTHLSRSSAARKVQTEALASLMEKLGPPALLLGDLNQKARELSLLKAAGFTTAKASPGLRGRLPGASQIDHILASSGVEVTSARVVPTKASDHLPMIADISLG